MIKLRLNEQTGMLEQISEERQGQGPTVDELMEQLALEPPEHLTPEQRRSRVAAYRDLVEGPWERGFRSYLRSGKDFLTDEQRALSTATTGGGYLAPASFASAFTVSLKQHDEIFEAASLIETDRGTAFALPIDDETSAVAAVVAESGTSNATAAVFDHVAFAKCPQFRSGMVVVPMELVQDSAYDLESLLANSFGRRMARGAGAAFITAPTDGCGGGCHYCSRLTHG